MIKNKFRVWNGSTMEHNVMVGALGVFYVQGMDENDSSSISKFNTKYGKNTPAMQFTGLTDKHGVEIYEGDVCKHDGDGLIAQIVFWEGAFIFNKYYIHDYSLSNFAPCRTFEVIGNIHANPELLS